MPSSSQDRESLLEVIVLAVLLFIFGKLTRKVVERAWRGATDTPPPKNPADPGVAVRDAVAWAVLSGVAVGLTRVAVRRTMASRGVRSRMPR